MRHDNNNDIYGLDNKVKENLLYTSTDNHTQLFVKSINEKGGCTLTTELAEAKAFTESEAWYYASRLNMFMYIQTINDQKKYSHIIKSRVLNDISRMKHPKTGAIIKSLDDLVIKENSTA